jgi:hypothetical protein
MAAAESEDIKVQFWPPSVLFHAPFPIVGKYRVSGFRRINRDFEDRNFADLRLRHEASR